MNDFKPSPNFTLRVMKTVKKYNENEKFYITLEYVYSKPIRYATCAGGAVLGIINFVRIFMTIFFPAVCR